MPIPIREDFPPVSGADFLAVLVQQAPSLLTKRRTSEQAHNPICAGGIGNSRKNRGARLRIERHEKALHAAVDIRLQIATDRKTALEEIRRILDARHA